MDMTIARTILSQLGGNKFLVMTGAKSLTVHENGLSMRIPSKTANYLKITLEPNDTYTMEFKKIWGMKVKDVNKHTDVYCDMLQSIFTEETGFDTNL